MPQPFSHLFVCVLNRSSDDDYDDDYSDASDDVSNALDLSVIDSVLQEDASDDVSNALDLSVINSILHGESRAPYHHGAAASLMDATAADSHMDYSKFSKVSSSSASQMDASAIHSCMDVSKVLSSSKYQDEASLRDDNASYMDDTALASYMDSSKITSSGYHHGDATSFMQYSAIHSRMEESKSPHNHHGDENVNNHTSPSFPSPKKMSSLKPRSQLKRSRNELQDESAGIVRSSKKGLPRSPKKMGQRRKPQSGHTSSVRQHSHKRSNNSSSTKKNPPQWSTKSPSNKKKRRKFQINVSSQSDEVSEFGDDDVCGVSKYPTPFAFATNPVRDQSSQPFQPYPTSTTYSSYYGPSFAARAPPSFQTTTTYVDPGGQPMLAAIAEDGASDISQLDRIL